MTDADPGLKAGLTVNLVVVIDGGALDGAAIVSIETWSAANRIPRARLVLYDGEPDTADFPLSNSGKLVPGAKVTLSAGYGGDAALLHTGVVIRHSIRIVPGQSPQLVIETADPLLRMTVARNSAVTPQISDADLIAQLVSAGGGTVGTNSAATAPVEAAVQYYATDWDLVLLRAEASGCLVVVDNASVDVIDPAEGGDPVLTAEYGTSIIAFEGTVDAAVELEADAVKSRAWSYADQAVQSDGGSTSFTPPGNLPSSQLAQVLGVSPAFQQTGAALDAEALGRWSSARLMRSRLAQVRGSARFQGSAAVKTGKAITLAGVGDRFNGAAFVSAVSHVVANGTWETTAEFGMAPESFASQRQDVAAPPASGLATPMRGLHTGQVKQVATDPTGNFRAMVTLPLASADNGVWARLGQFYASSGFGAVFYPEVGDEVILAFMDENPADPVILGSLYSSTRAPDEPYQPTEANDRKAVVSRTKLELSFNDKDTILTLKTPGGRCVTLDDTAKKVTIADPFNNSIVMTQDSVEVVANAALTLKAGTDLTIKAGGSINVSATQDYSLSAQQVSAAAMTNLSLTSDAAATLKGTSTLTLKAAMVLIN